MANISITNGLSTTTVEQLSDEQIDAIVNGKLAVAWDDELKPASADGDAREWLTSYCEAHEAKYGTALVIS